MFSLLAVFVVTLGIIWWMSQKEKDGEYKAIPGPMGLPVLGNVLQLSAGMHIAFGKWADKFGKIYQIKLGNRTTVVVSDPKWVKELFAMDFMTGRQFFEGFEVYPNEPLGLASIEGEMWEVHRRFLLRNIRDFGYGKSAMEEKIVEEVKETLDRLKNFDGKSISNTKEIFMVAVTNALWLVLGSQRFKQDDPKIIAMHKSVTDMIELVTKYAITFFIPWTRFLMPKVDMEKNRELAEGFYGTIIKSHEETIQEDSPRDFIDVYLNEMKANKDDPTSQFYGEKARRQLLVLLGDLLFAGTDTTSLTIQWTLLYLAKFKHVQEKLQKEISSITGDSRLVSIDDRPKMHYALSVLDEVLRFSSVLSTGVQRRATEGKEFKGYFIPQDAWVFPNLYHIHHSSELWGDPENFRPERFISTDGTYRKSDNLIPFQAGRRQCPGEVLARASLFLFITNIFQRFSVEFDPNKPEPVTDPVVGFNLSPPEYSIVLKERSIK